ncbi:MAG: TonB-dependent receptor [Nevskia sp.]|nr:TonB-dependent receptor [Nevskia sp.]
MNSSYPHGRHGRAVIAVALPRLLPLIAAVIAFPSAVRADDDPKAAVELDVITVRANPLGKTADELVQPSIVLSGAELDRKRANTIGETLENEPGISTTDFGPGAGRPVIRGQAGPRVDILENGIGSLDVSDVSPDHAVGIDTAHARQIEVLKGPATLLYGSRASGGIVNVINDRLPVDVTEGLHGSLDAEYGSNGDSRNGSTELGYGIGNNQFHVDASARKSGEYDIPGSANVDGSGSQGTLGNSRSQAQSGALSYGYIDGGNSVSFAVSTFNTVYGLPAEETAFIDLDQTRYDAQGILNKPLPGIDSIKIRGAYNSYTHIEFESPGEPGTQFFNKQNDERIEVVHAPILGWRGVFGVQHDFRRFAGVGEEGFVPPTHTLQLGAFLIEERPWAYGKLEAGVRVERDTNKPEEGADRPDRNFTPISASLGSIFNLAKDYHLKLYYSHAQRSPVPEELYSFGPHGATATFERGLTDARIETANNFEIGLDHHDQRLSWEGNVYYNSIRNYLYLAENDQGLNADGSGTVNADGTADRVDSNGTFNPDSEIRLVDYRQANTRFYGVEGQASYVLIQSPYTLSLRGFGDQVIGELNNGAKLPRVTPARFGLGVDGKYGHYSASVDYTRVFKQGDIASLETETGGYKLLGFTAAYGFRLSEKALSDSEVYIRGRNLLDDDARRATSFIKDVAPLPGASVFVGFRLAI